MVSIPYYKHIYKYGLSKFVRFAKEVWGVSADGKTDDEIALEGIDALAKFIKDLGIPTTLRELGTTEDMLPKIAFSTGSRAGYKKITKEEVLEILKECF